MNNKIQEGQRKPETKSNDLNPIISTTKEFIVLVPSKIVYCLAEGNYCRLFLESGEMLFLCKQIGSIEKLLPSKLFLRVHHSYLVNLTYVNQFLKKDGGRLQLATGHSIPVSRRRKQTVIRKWGNLS